MPTTSILEATIGLLDALDQLDVDLTPTEPSKGESKGQSRIRFFKSRKSVVKALTISASGLKNRIHGAVSLVSSLWSFCATFY